MSEPTCPLCKTEPPCPHLQKRTEPVVHYKIPPKAFDTELQLAGYLGHIMHFAKTSGLPLGSALYEHLQVFMARHELPYDFEYRKARDARNSQPDLDPGDRDDGLQPDRTPGSG
jgi:hypothetical protein